MADCTEDCGCARCTLSDLIVWARGKGPKPETSLTRPPYRPALLGASGHRPVRWDVVTLLLYRVIQLELAQQDEGVTGPIAGAPRQG
jgi:hypothetical protein